MESEKVKEIKKAIEYNSVSEFMNMLPYADEFNKLKMVSFDDILTLINELESENEKLKQHKRELEGGQRDLLKVIKEFDKETQQLKDRIAELEKENEIKTDTIVDLLKKQEFYEKEKLTNFAERLKEKCEYNRKQYCCSATVGANDIDETLKEFL